MAIRFRPPRDVPDLGLTRGQQERFNAWLRTAFTEIAEDMAALGQFDAPTRVEQETIDVPVGATRRVTPPTGGMAVRIPAPSPGNAGRTIRLLIEAPVGALTVVASPGVGDDGKVFQPTINGSAQATFTSSGLVELTSNGHSDWKTAAEFAAESPAAQAIATGQGVLDAEYVLGSADSRLTNGRVATDSPEIDADLTSAGLISWVLNIASVAFSKLANLTGLSVLGRAANSAGVMAAITATDAYQTLRSSDDGTTIGWESYLPITHTDTVSGTVEALPLPAGIKHGDFFNISSSTGNVILDGIDATGVPTGFSFYLGFTVTAGDILNTSFLLQDSQATVSSNSLQLPGNESVRMLSGSRVLVTRSTTTWRIEITPQLIIRNNGALEATRTMLNFVNSTTNTAVVNPDATNNEHEISFQRAAMTGFAAASANSNATTSAEPLVTYSTSGNMSAERVLTTSTSNTVSTAVAGQIQVQSAAKTGAISQAANANATLFAGIQDNGALETARTHLNFENVAFDTTASVVQDAGNDALRVRISTLGSFYSENSVGSFQTKFISFDDGSDTLADVVDNTGGSGFINVSYAVSKAAAFTWTGIHRHDNYITFGDPGLVAVGDIRKNSQLDIIGAGVHLGTLAGGGDLQLGTGSSGAATLGGEFVTLRADINVRVVSGTGGTGMGHLVMVGGASGNPPAADEGEYWVDDTTVAQTLPGFTDDDNEDFNLAYAYTNVQLISGTAGAAGTIALDDDTTVVRWAASTGAINVDGFSGRLWDGRRVLLRNANATGGNTVTINPEAAAATSTERIVGAGTGSATDASRTKVIRSRGQVAIVYDGTSTRWYIDAI